MHGEKMKLPGLFVYVGNSDSASMLAVICD
jgi:hypothetical protein